MEKATSKSFKTTTNSNYYKKIYKSKVILRVCNPCYRATGNRGRCDYYESKYSRCWKRFRKQQYKIKED